MEVITFHLSPPNYRGIFETQEEARQRGKTERVISPNSAILWGPGNTALETFGRKASHADERVILLFNHKTLHSFATTRPMAVTGQKCSAWSSRRLKLCLSHVGAS